MKATGIVRRIDDLGRIVIPKEIRRTLRIREGDPLEIYTEKDGEVIFKKYSPMGDLQAVAAQLCALAQGVTDAQVLGCSITFTGLCKTCQQADKGSASEWLRLRRRAAAGRVPGVPC